MKSFKSIIVISVLILTACGKINSQLKIVEAFPNLSFTQPVDIQNAGDASNRIFAVSQQGKIFVFENDKNIQNAQVFLDIDSIVLSGGEQGLLGLAFHPDYKNNGYFYVDHTASNPKRTVIARFNVSDTNPNIADPASKKILLEVNQPFSNHNGGQIAFGPDGYLYVSFGDGGSGGDPQNNGQTLTSLLGSIIRINVDSMSNGQNYSIPIDNPFYQNNQGYREEIFAYGLRNVWRFSFDKNTGKLWAADVGQNLWEEIDIIENGKNYGWNIMEGFHCYNASSCDTAGFTLPVLEYGHNSSGGFSITGGYVYRGGDAGELLGKYVYADYISGRFWALENTGGNYQNELIFETNYSVSTFGQDESGELYFANYSDGKIYKFEGEPVTSVGEVNPSSFELYQNYPNPFNPDSIIEYRLAENIFVVLEIFNALGKSISRLVNGEQGSGIHKVIFSGKNLASGLYIYRLSAGNFSDAKAMILIK